MKTNMTLFENYQIRRVYDEEAEIGWFSVIDIAQALTQQDEIAYEWRENSDKVYANTFRAFGDNKQ